MDNMSLSGLHRSEAGHALRPQPTAAPGLPGPVPAAKKPFRYRKGAGTTLKMYEESTQTENTSSCY